MYNNCQSESDAKLQINAYNAYIVLKIVLQNIIYCKTLKIELVITYYIKFNNPFVKFIII